VRIGPAALAVTIMLLPTAASAMTVAEFLAKADALKAKGMIAAALSPDVGLLRDETKRASDAYRADLAAAKKAKKPVDSCPPPPGQGSLSGEEWVGFLRTIPAAQRPKTNINAAFHALMKRRYPCK
jgi:hypothetical protein